MQNQIIQLVQRTALYVYSGNCRFDFDSQMVNDKSQTDDKAGLHNVMKEVNVLEAAFIDSTPL